jgi:hypothetical protein
MITDDAAQRSLLELLLDAHPSMLTIAEIHQRMPDGADADHALSQLMEDGLATRLGELLGATRTAIRARQLAI